VGLEALRTKDVNKTHSLLVNHINTLRTNSELARSLVVLVLESNLGFESQHLAAALQRAEIGNWICLLEGAGGAMGWLTTNATKEAMCLRTREALRVGSLIIWDKFQCLSQSPKDALNQLNKELSNFCIVNQPATHLFGIARKTYTGKVGGCQDDLCVALQLAISGSRVFKTSDKYSKFQWRCVYGIFIFGTSTPYYSILMVCVPPKCGSWVMGPRPEGFHNARFPSDH